MTDRKDAVFAAIRAFNPEWFNYNEDYAQLVLGVLSVDETPEGFLSQRDISNMAPYTGLWATNRRLLELGFNKPTFGKAKLVSVNEYAYSTIVSVTYYAKSGDASIRINRFGSWETFLVQSEERYRKVLIREFVELIRSHLLAPDAPSNQVASTPSSSDSLSDLERLVQLKTQGLLTEEEFKAAKAKLLGL